MYSYSKLRWRVAGISDDKLNSIHGILNEFICSNCDAKISIDDIPQSFLKCEDKCKQKDFGGFLLPKLVYYDGKPDLAIATKALEDCDLLLVIESLLSVNPVAELIYHPFNQVVSTAY